MSNEHYLQITAQKDLGGGNLAVNTFHVAPSDAGWIGTDRTTVANLFIGYLKTFYDAVNAAGVYGGQTIGSTVIEYEYGEDPKYVACTPQIATDTGTGALYPPQLAAVVSWRTALAGRSFRGRTYLGVLRSQAFGGNILTTTFASAVNTAATTLAGRASGSFRFCVVSKTGTRWHKTGDHTYASSFHTGFTTPITSGSTSTTPRTLRSRA